MKTAEKTIINIKVDKKLKEQARDTAEALGIPLGTIINAYLRNLVIERRVEFSAPLIPNAKTAKILDKIDKDIKSKKNMSHDFVNADEAIKYLQS